MFEDLEDGGYFIVTFRDLSEAGIVSNRFVHVHSEDSIILICLLEIQ